jgi:DegV family protein with EDD domain
LEEGMDILYIGFSSGLSGTYQAVSLALEELKEKYPERNIYSVDSLSAALGEGLLVRYAADLKEEGKSIEEVYKWVLENRLSLCHWFTVDDLFFLKRGGRVSATSAVLGTALSIKPVMHVDDEGHLIVMEKARGRKKALDALVAHMEETVTNPKDQIVYISHGDCLEDAEYVARIVKEKLQVKEVMVRILDPVIGAHSGPGTVALFFVGSKR